MSAPLSGSHLLWLPKSSNHKDCMNWVWGTEQKKIIEPCGSAAETSQTGMWRWQWFGQASSDSAPVPDDASPAADAVDLKFNIR